MVGNAAACKFGDVASLTGQLRGVAVQHSLLLVRAVAVAGDASGGVAVVAGAAHVCTLGVLGCRGVAAAGHVMAGGLVAGGAGEVQAGGVHVHIDGLFRRGQQAVHVAVFDAVATAAVEVAGAAGVAAGLADLLGNLGQVDRLQESCPEPGGSSMSWVTTLPASPDGLR